MFDSQVLEIAIGLCFVFAIASLLASGVREVIESVLKTRAVQLERGIRQLLDDPEGKGTTKALFDHPQVFGLFDGVYDPAKLTTFNRWWKKTSTIRQGAVETMAAKRLPLMSKFPSYIPSRNIAVALLDLLGAGKAEGQPAPTMEVLRANAMTLQPGRLRDTLLATLSEAGNDFDRARTSLEAWFDSGMDRVSGWYKRESQVILLAIGLVTAIVFNVDALHVGRQLAASNTVRQQVLLQAETVHQTLAARKGDQTTPAKPLLTDEELAKTKTDLGDLIGWQNVDFTRGSFSTLIGWLITALAISLGAPFWFDILNKIMVIRATVKPYEKSASEGSEDRKGGKPAAERLEPVGTVTTVTGGTAAIEDEEGDHLGHVRLAVDIAGVSSVKLRVDDVETDLPPDGFVEIPLTMGVDHRIAVRARKGVRPVSWQQTVRITTDNDLIPLDAALA